MSYYLVIFGGVACELWSEWYFRKGRSGIPIIGPLLISIGAFQSDWPIAVQVIISVSAISWHIGRTIWLYRSGGVKKVYVKKSEDLE